MEKSIESQFMKCKSSFKQCRQLEDSAAYVATACYTSTANSKATLKSLLFASQNLKAVRKVMKLYINSTADARANIPTTNSSSDTTTSTQPTTNTTSYFLSLMTNFTRSVENSGSPRTFGSIFGT